MVLGQGWEMSGTHAIIHLPCLWNISLINQNALSRNLREALEFSLTYCSKQAIELGLEVSMKSLALLTLELL